jgi:hypothetical protein
VILVLVLAVGCGAGSSPADAPPSSALDSPATPPVPSPSGAASTSPEDAVRSAYAAYDKAYFAALAAPTDSTKLAALLALYVPSTPARNQIAQRIQDYGQRGEFGLRGPAGYYVVETVSFSNTTQGRLATATVCTFDDARIYDATNKVNGKPIIVNDRVSGLLSTDYYLFVDDSWKLAGGTVREQWTGTNRCPPR